MTSTTLYPTGDTQVAEADPNENYCNYELMAVEAKDNERRSFIKFDISSLPEDIVINEAILYLHYYHLSEDSNDSGKINRATEDFDECNITWNNQPSVTSTHEVDIVLHSSGTWEDYDVTDLLQDACDENLDYFAMRLRATTGNDNHRFHTSNSDYDPYLTIDYTEPDYSNVYVKLSGDDSNDGLSWTNAKQTIKAGLETVATDGTLHIAFGDYSSQDAITLDKTVSLLCENEGGGGTGTVVLPPTA